MEQEQNKRSNKLYLFNDKMVPMSELARLHGMLPGTLYDRLDHGWPIEKALTTPIRKRRQSNETRD
jgi:hypothetical protein